MRLGKRTPTRKILGHAVEVIDSQGDVLATTRDAVIAQAKALETLTQRVAAVERRAQWTAEVLQQSLWQRLRWLLGGS